MNGNNTRRGLTLPVLVYVVKILIRIYNFFRKHLRIQEIQLFSAGNSCQAFAARVLV